jgi:hypothetical protein
MHLMSLACKLLPCRSAQDPFTICADSSGSPQVLLFAAVFKLSCLESSCFLIDDNGGFGDLKKVVKYFSQLDRRNRQLSLFLQKTFLKFLGILK